jgi:hypothetical protein
MLMGLFKRNSSREYDMGNPAKQVLILIVLFLLILFIILIFILLLLSCQSRLPTRQSKIDRPLGPRPPGHRDRLRALS